MIFLYVPCFLISMILWAYHYCVKWFYVVLVWCVSRWIYCR